MVYRVIGAVVGNLPQGLEIIFTELTETGGKWKYEIVVAETGEFREEWNRRLKNVAAISAKEYQLVHASFGRYIGELINQFIEQHGLEHRVHLIAFQGYDAFHLPLPVGAFRLGQGAFVAGETKLPVVSDFLLLDTAFGGQASPLAGIAEKLLPADEEGGSFPKGLVIALMGVLRWREEANMLASQTGASRDSIGGALWLGTEA